MITTVTPPHLRLGPCLQAPHPWGTSSLGDLDSPNQGSSYCAIWNQGRCLPTSCAPPGVTASGHRAGEAALNPRGTRAPCQEREQSPGPLTHRRTALPTGPLHPETLRAPRERPQGYQDLYPTSPSQGANALRPLDLRDLTDVLSAAPGYSQGPWLIGMGHCGGRGFRNQSLQEQVIYRSPSHLPSSPGASRNI